MAASAGHADTSRMPDCDRLRANIFVDRNATHALTAWLGLDACQLTVS